MEFVLLEKLAELEGIELYMLIIGALIAALLIFVTLRSRRRAKPVEQAKRQAGNIRSLTYGALCVSLSFVLSYMKLFSMPFGGSITLFSMLPIVVYAWYFGPARGFLAAFAYGVLQVIQGAYIVHPVQFILDYFVAFTCYGLASLFPKSLTLGTAVSGFSRMLVSVVSGVVFFSEYALDAGFESAWAYSFAYNGLTIGVDTVMCAVIAALPIVKKVINRTFS